MSKILDHRTSKTYDIKPVDKRGDLDQDKLKKGDSLVQLGINSKEQRSAQIFERFKADRLKVSERKLVFDIGKKGSVRQDYKKQELKKFENEKTTIEEEFEFQATTGTNELAKSENFQIAENESPEEVLENFKEAFKEKLEQKREVARKASETKVMTRKIRTTKPTVKRIFQVFQDEALVKNETERRTIKKNKAALDDYFVLEGNQRYAPEEWTGIKISKIETSGLQKFESKEQAVGAKNFSEKTKIKLDSPKIELSKEGEKLKKTELVEEWMSKEVDQRQEISAKRRVSEQLEKNSNLIEQNRREAEAKKEARREQAERLRLMRKKRSEENSLFWENKLQEKAIKFQKKDAVEEAIEKKSRDNEPIIKHKLNAWFEDEKIGKQKQSEKIANKQVTLIKKEKNPSSKSAEFGLIQKSKKQAEQRKKQKYRAKKRGLFSLNYREKGEKLIWSKLVTKPMLSFAMTSFVAFLMVSSIVFISYGFQVQENIKVKGEQALGHLDSAKSQLAGQDFLSAKTSFAKAVEEFESAQKELDRIGGDMLDVFSTLPILSRISSGKNVVDAGNELTKAAKELSASIEIIAKLENPFNFEEKEGEVEKSQQSMLEMLSFMQEKFVVAENSLTKAEKKIELVNIHDLPKEYQEKFQKIKDALPIILSMIHKFEQNSEIFLELLGHNGPRKYLLLFQNNQEMRATGGFVGSYGVLHISNGRITKLLIDGIYNPDGQLKYNIVPPLPIQKISASWSTHDANWFPHFPKTAEKISMFYEYTGGPTVDGIITITPIVLQRMLAITGPVEMEEYAATVNTENFVEVTQYEVEVNYDKTENKPKQFLADLAPKIITKLFDSKDAEDASMILEMFSDMLKERHIMLNSTNQAVQNAIAKQGWSGEILKTEKDYLMVINSNINGFKTDGVIDETITHEAKIAADGTITDTVKIKRVHNGGDTNYEWWNKVNSNYMRVYVPKGSKLLSVKGQTREINEELIDYDKLGFKRDKDVIREEESIELNEETGTRTYEEEGKTVFANWVYVSPKETVQVEYVYELPFKLDLHKNSEASDTYSLLVQKQAGSTGSNFSAKVEYAPEIKSIWMYPQKIKGIGNVLEVEAKLTTDLFFGTVFQGEEVEIQ